MTTGNSSLTKTEESMNESPIVSVIVLNYNHTDTIISTLDSIKSQTYKNIELIVADDLSTDDSMHKAKLWVESNKERFVRARIIIPEKNTGVTGNCNRGVKDATGSYIKLIASDDLLREFYVEKMLEGIGSNDLAFCYVYMFQNEDDLKGDIVKLDYAPTSLDTYNLSPRKLYKKQLMRNDFNAPAALIKRSVFDEVGLFDEDYPMMEDLPFWLKCVKTKRKIVFIDIYGVFYRRSPKSISFVVSPYADGSVSDTQKSFKSDFDRFMKVRRKRMVLNFMWREMYYSFGEKLFAKIKKESEDRGKAVKLLAKPAVLFAPFARLSRKQRRLDKSQKEQLRIMLAKHKREKDLYHLKKEYTGNRIKLRRSQMFKMRSTPLSREDKRRLRVLRTQYRIEKTKIKAGLEYDASRSVSSRFKRALYRWNHMLWRKAESWKSRGVPRIVCKSMLLFSPVAVYEKLNRETGEIQNSKCPSDASHDDYKDNMKLRHRLKNEAAIEESFVSKTHWSDIYKSELRYQEEYLLRSKSSTTINILFVVHLKFCFSAIESIYLEMVKSHVIEPLILVVPKKQPNMDKNFIYDDGLIEFMDKSGYAYELGFDNGQWKSIFEFDPDGIFYQTPYNWQRPAIYSYDCRFAFPRIMYTPYGLWAMDKSVSDFISAGIDPELFEKGWHIFMDKLSLEMLKYSAAEYSVKCIHSGSPKVDFYRDETVGKSYCWSCDEKGSAKRIIWMPRWGIADGRTSFPSYYKYFQRLVNEKNIDLVMRPHPLLWGDLINTKFFTELEHEEMINKFETPKNSAIDYGFDYREGLLSCDFLVMDFSSIVYEYIPTGKPVIYTKRDNTLIEPRLMEACYTVENQEELEATINMLISGEDPKKEMRLQIVKELEYFPHDCKTNGEYITNYIVDNIRGE